MMKIKKPIVRLLNEYVDQPNVMIPYMVILSILQSVILLPSLYFIRQIFDQDIPNNDTQRLIIDTCFILGLIGFHSTFSMAYRNFFLKKVKTTSAKLKREVVEKICDSDKEYIDVHSESELMILAVDDIDRIDRMLDGILSTIFPQISLFIIGIVVLTIINPVIGVCSLVLGFLGFFNYNYLKKGITEKIKNYLTSRENLSKYVQYLPTKWTLIKMRNSLKKEMAIADQHINALKDIGTSAAKGGWKVKIGNDLFTSISATLLLLIGALQVQYGLTSYGTIFGLYYLIIMIRRTVSSIQTQWPILQEGKVSLEKFLHFKDVRINKQTNEALQQVEEINSLRLDNISFRYPNTTQLILKNVSLDINLNETILITGLNGAGKSSLIQLILGFYLPVAGEVYVNDVPFKNINLSLLRQKMGYLPQTQIMVEGTVEDNLLYGLEKESVHSLSPKLLNSLLKVFQDGLETPVSAKGNNLSNGQLQRISILRSLISKPDLLILDEPTNHLDLKAVELLVSEIKKIENMTIIIISHTASISGLADKTYFLKDQQLIKKLG